MKLTDIDKKYLSAYESQSSCFEQVYEEAKENKLFNLESIDVSVCLVQRMVVYYETQNRIKSFINKRYSAPAADFFVESVAWFLKLALELSGSKLEVHSERQIKRKRSSIRPDISIWKEDEVVSIIECKTQLGRSRTSWKKEFDERERKLKEDFPNAKAYLFVMTGNNWGGFSEKDLSSGKYYCLLKDKWPTGIDNKSISRDIQTPVENLIKIVLKNG